MNFVLLILTAALARGFECPSSQEEIFEGHGGCKPPAAAPNTMQPFQTKDLEAIARRNFLDQLKRRAIAASVDAQMAIALRRMDQLGFEITVPKCFQQGHYPEFREYIGLVGAAVQTAKDSNPKWRMISVNARSKYHDQLLRAAVSAQYWDKLVSGVEGQVKYYEGGGVEAPNVQRLEGFYRAARARRSVFISAFPALDVNTAFNPFQKLRSTLEETAKNPPYNLWVEPPDVGAPVTAIFPRPGLLPAIMKNDGRHDALASPDPKVRAEFTAKLAHAEKLDEVWKKPISPVNHPALEEASKVADQELFKRQKEQIEEICNSSGEDLVRYDNLVDQLLVAPLPRNQELADSYHRSACLIRGEQIAWQKKKDKIFAFGTGAAVLAAVISGGVSLAGSETASLILGTTLVSEETVVIAGTVASLSGGAAGLAGLGAAVSQEREYLQDRRNFLANIATFDQQEESYQKAKSMLVMAALVDAPMIAGSLKSLNSVRRAYMSRRVRGDPQLADDLTRYMEREGVEVAAREIEKNEVCFLGLPGGAVQWSPWDIFIPRANAGLMDRCGKFFAAVRGEAKTEKLVVGNEPRQPAGRPSTTSGRPASAVAPAAVEATAGGRVIADKFMTSAVAESLERELGKGVVQRTPSGYRVSPSAANNPKYAEVLADAGYTSDVETIVERVQWRKSISEGRLKDIMKDAEIDRVIGESGHERIRITNRRTGDILTVEEEGSVEVIRDRTVTHGIDPDDGAAAHDAFRVSPRGRMLGEASVQKVHGTDCMSCHLGGINMLGRGGSALPNRPLSQPQGTGVGARITTGEQLERYLESVLGH